MPESIESKLTELDSSFTEIANAQLEAINVNQQNQMVITLLLGAVIKTLSQEQQLQLENNLKTILQESQNGYANRTDQPLESVAAVALEFVYGLTR